MLLAPQAWISLGASSTTSLLSTGVDAPTIKNVVIFRVVGAMAEFKQITGRGTRVRAAEQIFVVTTRLRGV